MRGRVQLVDLLSTRRQFAAAAISQSDIECVIYVPSEYEHFAVTLEIYSLFLFHFPPFAIYVSLFRRLKLPGQTVRQPRELLHWNELLIVDC